MKEIELTQGKFAIVDNEDYERVSDFKWYYSNGYAVRKARVDGKQMTLLLHRYILGLDFGDKRCVDHINHNTLDNRKSNLRICTVAENSRNVRKPKTNTSNFKGVRKAVYKYARKDGTKKEHVYWKARIKVDGKEIYLGCYPYTPEGKLQAAAAYDAAALEYFGEYAFLNEIPADKK